MTDERRRQVAPFRETVCVGVCHCLLSPEDIFGLGGWSDLDRSLVTRCKQCRGTGGASMRHRFRFGHCLRFLIMEWPAVLVPS